VLYLTKGSAGDVVVTLNEYLDGTPTHYLFVFRNLSTLKEVTEVIATTEDQSEYQDRYNKYEISALINESAGIWGYKVYAQNSATNTLVGEALYQAEEGFLTLLSEEEITVTEYTGNECEEYKQYEG
jgi:hypothetical protein